MTQQEAKRLTQVNLWMREISRMGLCHVPPWYVTYASSSESRQQLKARVLAILDSDKQPSDVERKLRAL